MYNDLTKKLGDFRHPTPPGVAAATAGTFFSPPVSAQAPLKTEGRFEGKNKAVRRAARLYFYDELIKTRLI